MSNTYFENGILKLRNVVVKLSNQGEIEIWDDDEIYQLKFESVKLSNKDLNNIYNLVDKNWGGFIGSPKYYSYLSDYLEEKDDDDNDDDNDDDDDNDNLNIELDNPKDLESHLLNINNLLKIYSINFDDDFKILEVERNGCMVIIHTNITKNIIKEYESCYFRIIKKYRFKREQPIESLWEDNRFIFKLDN